jgi:uncharacterized lipoprotein YajG
MIFTIFSQAKSKLVWIMTFLIAVSLLTGCAGQKTVVVKHYQTCHHRLENSRKALNKAPISMDLAVMSSALIGSSMNIVDIKSESNIRAILSLGGPFGVGILRSKIV